MRFSKRIIIALLVLIVLFVSVMTVTYWVMGDVPEPLITAVAAMVTAESGFLMLIKNVDSKYKDKDNNNDENESEEDENDGCNTNFNGDDNLDNIGDNGIPDTLSQGEDR